MDKIENNCELYLNEDSSDVKIIVGHEKIPGKHSCNCYAIIC